MATNTKLNLFNDSPPTSGGNTYTVYDLIKAIDNNIQSTYVKANVVSKAITKANSSAANSYNTWWLLQFQADYFSNLIDFKLDNWEVNRQVAIAIRLGVIYGSSVLWKRGNTVTAMYVNSLELNENGQPARVKMYRGDYVLMNQSLDFKKDGINWIERDILGNSDFIVFIPNDYNLGGLIKWMPFINQLERLLKMVYTHSYSYTKSILYNVKDKNVIADELALYFSCDNPFLINTGDESVLSNKFKEFEIHKNNGNTDGLIQYVKEFLNLYYDLIGRRYNSDKKKERNISNEVDASQENYDILQRPIKRNIEYLIAQIEERWGWKNQKTAKEQEEGYMYPSTRNEAENDL